MLTTKHPPKLSLLQVYCPHCSEKNPYYTEPGDVILDHTLTCRGCAKLFHFALKWNAEIATFKE